MKKLLKPSKGRLDKTSLKYILHKELCGYEDARSVRKLHASELLKEDIAFCPREHALLDELNKERPKEFVPTSSRVTWDLGNDFAEYIIQKLGNAGVVIGDWSCNHCNRTVRWKKRPKECKKCGHKAFKHIESRFTSKTSGISAGIDFFYKTEDSPKIIPVEMKTMMKEQFKTLAAPLSEHKARTSLYLQIIDDSDHPHKDEIETSYAKILYLCKGGYRKDDTVKLFGLRDFGMSPFEEFLVKRDDSINKTKWSHALLLKKYRDNPKKKNIPLGVCHNVHCKRAQQCSVKDVCFSNAYKTFKGE